jgi:hypothetical protein
LLILTSCKSLNPGHPDSDIFIFYHPVNPLIGGYPDSDIKLLTNLC